MITMSLGMTYFPTILGGGAASYKQCLHIVMVNGKCTDVFRGIFRFGGELGGLHERVRES